MSAWILPSSHIVENKEKKNPFKGNSSMSAWILESMLVFSNNGSTDWKFVKTLGWPSTYEGRTRLI
jgi:hypothetical protein